MLVFDTLIIIVIIAALHLFLSIIVTIVAILFSFYLLASKYESDQMESGWFHLLQHVLNSPVGDTTRQDHHQCLPSTSFQQRHHPPSNPHTRQLGTPSSCELDEQLLPHGRYLGSSCEQHDQQLLLQPHGKHFGTSSSCEQYDQLLLKSHSRHLGTSSNCDQQSYSRQLGEQQQLLASITNNNVMFTSQPQQQQPVLRGQSLDAAVQQLGRSQSQPACAGGRRSGQYADGGMVSTEGGGGGGGEEREMERTESSEGRSLMHQQLSGGRSGLSTVNMNDFANF